GSQLSVIAFPLLVLSLGSSVAQAGLVGTCSLLTRLVFRLPGGHLADRCDRRMLMVATDLIRLVAVGSIPLAAGLGRLGFGQLLVVAIIEGTATAAFSPAAGVAVRDVVSRDEMADALGKIQATSATALLVGPALGGWLFSVDRILPFTVDALSYALSAVLLLRLRVRPERAPVAERDDRLTAGLRWLRGQPALLWVLLFVGTLNFTGAALEVGVVLVLRQHGTSSSSIGIVMACLGVGSIAGALVASRIIKVLAAGRLLLVIGLIWTAGFVVLASQPPLPVTGLVLVLLLLVTPAAGIQLGEAIMVNTPRDLLGRVNTAIGTVTAGLASLGPLLVGLTVAGFGGRVTWLVLAGVDAGVTLIAGLPLLRMSSFVRAEPASEPTAEQLSEPAIERAEPAIERAEPAVELAEVIAHVADPKAAQPDRVDTGPVKP
ncbi:MAG: MFS transporter, partial [Jatrophihabitantaceae bacterium]